MTDRGAPKGAPPSQRMDQTGRMKMKTLSKPIFLFASLAGAILVANDYRTAPTLDEQHSVLRLTHTGSGSTAVYFKWPTMTGPSSIRLLDLQSQQVQLEDRIDER